ncbi:MAG: 4-phosphopantoate--beta-alanine ligase, partial [Enterobacterales bacterium]|nr:4-phosphopantoate--beta-alanine ligase [Enterobacterales bacterium]
GVAAVLTPLMSDIYPQGVEHHTQVMVPDVSELHCGEHRPGHFTGVATIVTKLLNICRPDIAIFGQKDYQQLAIIRKMVADLAIQTKIIGEPTVRNTDGLALSSRNNYLSDSEKHTAAALFQTLTEVSDKITAGNHDYLTLTSEAMAKLNNIGFEMEYINIVDQMSLLPATENDNNLVILAAGRMAGTRLIDNLEISLV